MKYQTYRFGFQLSNGIQANKLVDSHDIQCLLEVREGKKFVVGFSVLIQNMKKVSATYQAKQKAIALANFISVRSRTQTRPIYTGYNIIMKNGRERVRRDVVFRYKHIKELELDLTDKRIYTLLSNQEQAQLYNYASRGIRGDDEDDYVGMIRDFYQIIEKKDWKRLPADLKEFKWLRDVLSHKGIRTKIAIQEIKNSFGTDYFDLTPAGYFDYTSSKNIQHLRKSAKRLMKKALKKLPIK
jgi:hypothetical protein